MPRGNQRGCWDRTRRVNDYCYITGTGIQNMEPGNGTLENCFWLYPGRWSCDGRWPDEIHEGINDLTTLHHLRIENAVPLR